MFSFNFFVKCIPTNILGFTYRNYTKLSYMHHVGKQPLQVLTIGNVLDMTALKYPDRTAVVSMYQKDRINFSDMLVQADKLAAGLRRLGMEKGSRIGIWAPNITEWVITKLASARAGLIMATLNPVSQAKELTYCINKIGIKTIVCMEKHKKINYYEILNDMIPELKESDPGKLNCDKVSSLKNIIAISDRNLRGTFNYNDVMHLASTDLIEDIKNSQHLIKFDDPCTIQFTSGTTGRPKAVLVSHFNLVNNAFNIGLRNELDQKHHRICVQVPLFHTFGVTITIIAALYFGATIVLPSPSYNSNDNLRAINDEKCTTIHGTPTMYVDLINAQIQQNLEVGPEIAVSGGAPCSPELFRNMRKYLKLKKVKSVYGLTEASPVIFQSLPTNEDEYKATATVGHLGDHMEVKVVDENNNLVPFGKPGELCVRGYSVMLGYWQDEEKTKEILGSDRWLRTGDQFVLQEDGYGKIVGRIKDMVIRGGENIFPKEIEDVLNQHEDILEAQVIGLAHERLGEELCACVRLKQDKKLTHEALVAFCKEHYLENFKIPSQLRIVDEFPKTLSGKIQKNLLKKKFEQSK